MDERKKWTETTVNVESPINNYDFDIKYAKTYRSIYV